MSGAKKWIPMVFCCILVFWGLSFAQENYPTRPIQIIVPYAPGGNLDLISRSMAEKFREYFRQPVLIINKPGATGSIGSAYVATS